MKCNLNYILEAIHRGIHFALDDFDDNDLIGQLTLTIKDQNITIDYLKWQDLINKFDDGRELLTKNELRDLSKISKKLGYKYNNFDNQYMLGDIIDNVCQVDPTVSLNWLDVSHIKDMDELFSLKYTKLYNGDISEWNVSNVLSMEHMFDGSHFNKDISRWNVSKCENFRYMFYNSRFNKDISNWNVDAEAGVSGMFGKSRNSAIKDFPIKYMPKTVQLRQTTATISYYV